MDTIEGVLNDPTEFGELLIVVAGEQVAMEVDGRSDRPVAESVLDLLGSPSVEGPWQISTIPYSGAHVRLMLRR